MNKSKIKKTDYLIWLVLFGFALIYAMMSLVNHYYFRTFALDLGLHLNAMYDYARFTMNYSPLHEPSFHNLHQLGDHLDFMVMLLSPLIFVFGTYSLLIAQIIAILAGAFGTYLFFKNKTQNTIIPILAAIHFCGMWAVFSALSFDYHSSVIGSSLLPWFIYYFDKSEHKKAALFFILIISCKEVLAFWMVFVCIGLAIHYFLNKPKQNFRVALLFSAISLIYFIVAIKLIMPAFMPASDKYHHFVYSLLGDNFGEAIKTIISKPLYVLRLLFNNPEGVEGFQNIKSELHIYILLSGGFALILRPQFMIMVISVYFQKLLNDDPQKWGINYHYNMEFVPVITFALFLWLNDLKISRNMKTFLATFLVLLSLSLTLYSMDSRYSVWWNKSQMSLLDSNHYKRDFDATKVQHILAKIPSDIVISANSPIVPHLSIRKTIYQFPFIGNASLIILLNDENTYPLKREQFEIKIMDLEKDSSWIKIYDENRIIIFKNATANLNFDLQ